MASKPRKPRTAKSAPAAPAPVAPASAAATNTDKPQDGGVVPAVQALEAGGPEATANDSAGSAADAVTPAVPVIVVKGPRTGFRRAGLLFTGEPRKLGVAELGQEIVGARRLLAILREPRLAVRLHLPDGTDRPFSADEIDALDLIVGGIPESQLDQARVDLIAQLTSAD